MTKTPEARPPRPIAPGDIVAAFCEELGQWSAAQVTDLDPRWPSAGLLDLDWSGPEPSSLADLGQPAPLRLTRGNWAGKLSQANYNWLLPRGAKIIGTLPLLHDRRSTLYAPDWRIGRQLARQRRWDAGDRGPRSDPRQITCTGGELHQVLADPAEPRHDVWSLTATDVTALDCAPRQA
jgi:hypothetical protein